MKKLQWCFIVVMLCAVVASRLLVAAQESVVSGWLQVYQADTFKDEPQIQIFTVTTDKGETVTLDRPIAGGHSGDRIRVKGVRRGSRLAATSAEITLPAISTQPWTFGNKSVLVVLVNSVDRPDQPWTPDYVLTRLRDTEAFYQANSYGAVTGFSPITVKGWFTSPTPIANGCIPYDFGSWGLQQATAQGINTANYKFIITISPSSNCPWAGLGALGGFGSGGIYSGSSCCLSAWINGDLGAVTHEVGHLFGAYHAHSVTITSGSERIDEYGDFTDVMGGVWGSYAGSWWNPAAKKIRGVWLDYPGQPDILTVTASGTYDLSAYQGAGTVKALRIRVDKPDGRSNWYYVHSRIVTGMWDGVQSTEVFVHRVDDHPLIPGMEQAGSINLLDMDPGDGTQWGIGIGQSAIVTPTLSLGRIAPNTGASASITVSITSECNCPPLPGAASSVRVQ